MSTNDLERQVSAVLHRHASDVMQHTDTTRSYARFLERAEQDRRRQRTQRSVVAVLAAAAAAAAAVVGPGLVDRFGERPAPASEVVTPAEEVAYEMMRAFGSQDVRAMKDLLAPGAVMFPKWQAEMRVSEAVGASIEVELCEEVDRLSDGRRVGCVFSMHMFHSDRIGRDPFLHNVAMVQVRDGEVTRMTLEYSDGESSVEKMHDEIKAWMSSRYPDEVDLMFSGWPVPDGASEQEVDRLVDLWERRTAEFAAEQAAR